MAQLPQRLTLEQMQPKWASQLNPVISCPLVNGRIVTQTLAVGANVINTGLGRELVGWIPIGQTAASNFYDTQAANTTPNLTLNINSSAACTASFWVF